MHRRQVLLGLMLAIGGPSVAAGCDTGASDDEILRALRPDGRLAFYRPREFQVLGVMADAIIPRTDTPGAIDAQVPAYIDAMISAWASRDTKRKQRRSFAAVRRRLRDLAGQDILKVGPDQRLAALASLDAEAYAEGAADDPLSAAASYRALKTMIVQVYYATEIGATQELHYELVPGRWLADAPLSQVGRTWAF